MPLLIALLPLALAGSGPEYSHTRGLYDAAFDLEITPSEEGASVYVSLDALEPTELYSAPISIDSTTIVRAVEVYADGTESEIKTHTFLFLSDVIEQADMDQDIVDDPTYGPILLDTLATLPSISIVASNVDFTEKEVSLEWIDPDGDDDQVSCGARRVGGHSVVYPKNSIRLTFRSDYGTPKWEIDLYGDAYTGVEPADEHDMLTLRGGNHDTPFYLGSRGQYLRNFWMDESQLEQDQLAPHGRFAHLYIDGKYTGLYHVRERMNAAFMAEYLGGEEEDYEAVNGGTAFDGSGAAWATVMANAGDWEELTRWIDMENFLDYMVLNFYAGNAWDWAYYHNWIAAGPTEADQGGFKFHSSDSDICLYYDYTVNILTNPGPSYVFYYLLLEGHPDFQVALMDAIHRNLEGDGPLNTENATARYERLAALVEDAVVAESARWNGDAWNQSVWETERDNLLTNWFPYRSDEMVRQVQEAGWYPLPAPEFDAEEGVYPSGTTVTASVPAGEDAELWLRLDGEDPRLPGGEIAPEALGPDAAQSFTLEHSALVRARLRTDESWGPLEERLLELDETPPIVLNEWNAVEDGHTLDEGDADGEGADLALGVQDGNGGDWLELLVLEDHLDLRGWRLTMEDRGGVRGELTFTDAEVLADLRSGTLITLAEELPEDTSYDPERGDWRFHLRAGADGSGEVVSAADFDVTHRDWRLSVWDTEGWLRFGPAGETVVPDRGISSDEVGLLARDPGEDLRRDDPFYTDGNQSTYGYPNRWEGGEQDLSTLRAVIADDDPPLDTGPWESATPSEGEGEGEGEGEDTVLDSEAPSPEETGAPKPTGCACDSEGSGGPGPGLALALVAALALRRRPLGLGLLGLAGCTPIEKTPAESDPPDETAAQHSDSTPGPDSAETADTADTADAACQLDADGDGYGDPLAAAPCWRGVADATDCDDREYDVHPGADELCDDIDQDCDGSVDEDPIDGLPFYADTDGDGYGDASGAVLACSVYDGAALVGGDCDEADPEINPGADELCDDIDQDCDGVATDALGSSAACAASSCLEIAEAGGASSGPSWITLPSGDTIELWCDQDTDGGGWTLGFLRNSAGDTSQGDFGSGYEGTDGLASSPEEASASSSAIMAWIDLNDFEYTELTLSAYSNGDQTYLSDAIPQEELRIDFGQDGYYLFGGDTGYYWCGGDASYTDTGIGATDNPPGAPPDCKAHGSLGSGWDFSESTSGNAGLTLCGGDGSSFLAASWGGSWTWYGTAGGAQAIWVR